MEGGFGDFYGQTSLHPLALAAVIILGLITFAIRKQLALAPLIAAATTLPMSQRIIVAGGDFTLMRILLLACCVRILFRREYQGFRWHRLDTAVALWTLSGTIVSTIHYGTVAAMINRLGWSFDILVTYFAVRCLVRRIDDVLALGKVIAVASVPIAALFLVEASTHRNLFSVFGGVPAETVMREGKFRCQGAFAHPIIAGTFWASALPMLWMLWEKDSAARRWAVIGTAATMVIIFACSSSTPMLSALFAGMGLALFRYRGHRRRMWIGMVALLLVLHLVMDRPVWHLVSRIDLVGGSTGWHRFIIFDTFIKHFSSWFLTGDSDATAWGVWQMRDITNQFMLEGLRGGILTLFFFVLVLIYSFGNVGRTIAGIEHLRNPFAEKVAWLVGVTIMVHTVTFFGVSYFGQMTAMLCIHFGLAGALVPQIMPNLLSDAGAPPAPATRPGRPAGADPTPPARHPTRGARANT